MSDDLAARLRGHARQLEQLARPGISRMAPHIYAAADRLEQFEAQPWCGQCGYRQVEGREPNHDIFCPLLEASDE